MQKRIYDRTAESQNKPGKEKTPAQLAERMRGHARFYMHRAEEGPNSKIGAWMWKMASVMEKTRPRLPEQRKPDKKKSNEGGDHE